MVSHNHVWTIKQRPPLGTVSSHIEFHGNLASSYWDILRPKFWMDSEVEQWVNLFPKWTARCRNCINVNACERETEWVYCTFLLLYSPCEPVFSRHVCWDGNKFSSFTEWQHSLYHPSLRVTQAYDVSVTLFMPLAAEHTFYHGSTSPLLVLPVYDDFLPRSAALLALFKQM